MTNCMVCLTETTSASGYHTGCLKMLFGTTKPPTLDIEISQLHTAALAMAGHSTLSGIQKKLSVNLAFDRKTLTVAATGGLYILKPQTGIYPALPENEHVTTQLAKLAGIEVAPSGLVRLKDDTLAFVVRRFDRLATGKKLRQEDFCQLAEQSPKEKYQGSAEQCVRLLRRYATEPLIELQKLYRLMVFVWWSGNGDMHLKNFSLLTGEDGITRLTPAYDLVCTELVLPSGELALPIHGKKSKLRRGDWKDLAEYCQLPEMIAARIIQNQAAQHPKSQALIERSYLPDGQKQAYLKWIVERSEELGGS